LILGTNVLHLRLYRLDALLIGLVEVGCVTVRVFVMLGIYFVSMKYVFVKCKACVCLCETFENLKVLIKRVFL
jgi:hypothetical protein